MAVAVHIRIGIGGSISDQIESVFPTEVIQDGSDNEYANDNSVADKLVGNHGLNKKRKQDEDKNLCEGDEIQLFILEQFVVIVSSDGASGCRIGRSQ